MDLLSSSLTEISNAVKNKKVSAEEVASLFYKRMKDLNPSLNAVVFENEDLLKDARAIDGIVANGEKLGPLAGVPFGIKDMLCVRNLPATAGSKILQNFIPPYDATVVAKLKAAGAVILGKLNQDEFAMGSSNETSIQGSVRNPWNTQYVPGGSSGGSAAAQASRLMAATLGTDTGGSIRQPASFCGVVGVKPTYGRVSRYGVIAYASSLDQVGPMASTVEDAALVLEVISGFDPKDSTSSQREVPNWSQALSRDLKGVRVGLLKECMKSSLHKDVEKSVENSVAELKRMGAEIVEVSLPLIEYAVPVYYLIAACEASSNLARYDGVKYGYRADFKNLSSVDIETFYSQTRGEGFGAEVKRRIMMGTHALSSGYYDSYYLKAGKVRRLFVDQYKEAFKQCDVILSPVTTAPAFRLGERIADPLQMYMNDVFTTSTNLAGLPGMSVPFDLSEDGLPVGVQITANHFDEQKMLDVAWALESVAPVKGKRPHVF